MDDNPDVVFAIVRRDVCYRELGQLCLCGTGGLQIHDFGCVNRLLNEELPKPSTDEKTGNGEWETKMTLKQGKESQALSC